MKKKSNEKAEEKMETELYEGNRRLTEAEVEQYRRKYLSSRYMDLRCDWAFKHVMRDLNILKMLIGDVLGEDISDISHLPNEVDRFLGKEKDVTMDVLCRDTRGREFIVEVQQRKTLSFRDRILYYGAAMIHAQIARGADYNDLRPVYVICFVDYEYEHTDDKVLYRYSIREDKTGEPYNNLLNICVCELPRLKKHALEKMDNLEVWLLLFNKIFTFAGEPSGLPERFAPVFQAAQMPGMPDDEQTQYLQAMISQREKEDIGGAYYLDGHKAGLAEGKAEGLAEGKAEALMETARRMKAAGADAAYIKAMTGVEV